MAASSLSRWARRAVTVPTARVAPRALAGAPLAVLMRRLSRSLPLRHPVRVRLWRVPRAEVPTDRDAAVAWLWDRWSQLDDWVDAEGRGRQEVA